MNDEQTSAYLISLPGGESAEKQHAGRELDEAKEVGRFRVPARRYAAEALELREQPLDASSPLVAAELASVLLALARTQTATLRRDQIDPAFVSQALLEHAGIPHAVPDQARR